MWWFLKKDSVMPNQKVLANKTQTAKIAQARATVAHSQEENLRETREPSPSTEIFQNLWMLNVTMNKALESHLLLKPALYLKKSPTLSLLSSKISIASLKSSLAFSKELRSWTTNPRTIYSWTCSVKNRSSRRTKSTNKYSTGTSQTSTSSQCPSDKEKIYLDRVDYSALPK